MTAYPITVPRYERIGRVRIFGNHYRLLDDWSFCSVHIPPGTGQLSETEFIRIQRTLAGCIITIFAGFEWDGATWVPDFWPAKKGSLPHDGLYRALDAIVFDFQCSLREARYWADAVFTEVNKTFGMPFIIRRVYHRGVRWFGGIARRWSR